MEKKATNSNLSLARLRFPLGASRGRRYPELSHPYRNEFQRDRDRIVHARAFRRLEDKTQVFGTGYSDHFRNRLTHTLEVSQLSRTVAGTLGLDEDLTEALALVHDIGPPPFAHAGEDELDHQMQKFGDSFDHNIHALHIVEEFEQRYASWPGLNLTFEVREGIVKHSRDFAPGEFPYLDEYLPGQKPPLEAQLIDLTDEIAYNTADFDDAFDAGFVTLSDLQAISPLCVELAEQVDIQFPAASEKLQFQELLRRVLNALVSGLIEGTYLRANEENPSDFEEVRRVSRRLATFTPQTRETSIALKRFLYQRVYSSNELNQERDRSRLAIAELFQFFLRNPEKFPSGYQQNSDRPLHRVVCSYIAGMTDGFLTRTAQELLG